MGGGDSVWIESVCPWYYSIFAVVSLLLDRDGVVSIHLFWSVDEKFVHCNRRCSEPTLLG